MRALSPSIRVRPLFGKHYGTEIICGKALLWTVMIVSVGYASGQAPSHQGVPEVEESSSLPTPKLPDNVKVVRNVEYCTGGGHPLLLDMYLPRGPVKKSTAAVL